MTAGNVKTPVPSIAATVSDLVSADGRNQIRHNATWIHVTNPLDSLPEHGWKFHISSRLADYFDLVTVLVPFLLTEGCTFKLARSMRVLSELNDGGSSPPSVGKAVTVYPDQDRVTQLGARLAELLRGRLGPRVLSDRQVAPDAPVYYRYGPFRSTVVASTAGDLKTVMVGPSGDTFEGLATTTYQQPPWADDPFRPATNGADAPAVETDQPTLLGNHYELFNGLLASGRGNVYAATDVRTDETVVVKEARAYVAESPYGDDARIRLRNERFVLSALHDVPRVARFRDHFRHGTDEYLVTSFNGKFNLSENVARKGRYVPLENPDPSTYPPALADSRSLDALAHPLARTLREIHARGYLVRDLSPKNIVVSMTGDEVTYIDFGHCNHHDVVIRGGTKGYATERQTNEEPAEPGDDFHALGMTLFAAATGAEPIVVDDDPDASRVMALRMIDQIYRDQLPPVMALVADLLSGHPDTMVTAFTALADGRVPADPRRLRRHSPAVHRHGPDTGTLVDRVLTELVSRTNEVLDESREPDANVYRGAAGIGLSLLPHLDRPGVATTVARLASFTSRTARQVKMRPALYVGSTGVELFLRRAIAASVEATPLPAELLFGEPEETPEGDDIIVGAAGVGLGHLLLNELDPRPEHDEKVRQCLELLDTHDDAVSFFPTEDVPIPGLDTTIGVAHGQAGVVEFFRQLCRLAPSDDSRRLLTTRLATLTDGVTHIVEASGKPNAVPLCTSWCRGMAGMGRVMLAAGRQLGDRSLIDLAVACGDGCLRWLPYLTTPGQCCGVAGIGELFCDLVPHDDRFLAAAESATTQMLLLHADAPPTPPARNLGRPGSMSWASGAAGVLAFLTRFRDLTPSDSATAPF
ncbi:MAG TPA: lanthionine synthetase LanC family protein [Actinophytocola sp.]|uniref:class III lanthionine synthetase LanKC N-terminal domain-containing protein n=1 Tax=Actinophytocola sp. TaxID=1872138 RepID=UPI002DBFA974|nr:lanthionine synthetase LanC family protein [Actinophytocola sp.]HEU5474704.1 lanthionine synthetase LanC family protein [Actinophytocola sp.]